MTTVTFASVGLYRFGALTLAFELDADLALCPVLIPQRFAQPLGTNLLRFVGCAPTHEADSEVVRINVENVANVLERIGPPGILIPYPSLRVVEQLLTPSAFGAEILLEALDGVR